MITRNNKMEFTYDKDPKVCKAGVIKWSHFQRDMLESLNKNMIKEKFTFHLGAVQLQREGSLQQNCGFHPRQL